MAESRVRVGLRIRPLLTKEKGQNVTFNSYDKQSVNFKGNTYTFDHVFGMELSQSQLYNETASPMLRSFLEGYNCTIMAYGQTGSGKTFSMGTSDIIYQDIENQGLISRFVTDLFANLNQSLSEGRHLSYQVKASYLEIYGEEVFDLLDVSASTNNRLSLLIREDESGKIFVQGQNELIVASAESALEVLSSGARHRITASTAMNSGSSRSHAVFTLLLEQKFKTETSASHNNNNNNISSSNNNTSEEETVVQVMCSKLTFVDLAGSERLKRTGAEGQRLKEGIQINSGLFNLGQVINALADEQKLKSGLTKSNHIPYRNSKLTHLLKDALGGNSQTLFLACVSPAESNENETLSTLMYAKQARNIQNKPIQNVDKVQKELQRLRYAVKVWTMKAVKSIFSNQQSSSSSVSKENIIDVLATEDFDQIAKLPEVSEFISSVNNSIEENICKSNNEFLSPRKSVRLSVGNTLIASPLRSKMMMRSLIYSPIREQRIRSNTTQNHPNVMFSSPPLFPGMNGAYMQGAVSRESMLVAFPSLLNSTSTTANNNGGDTEETEKLIARMIDMVQKEKEIYLANNNINHCTKTTTTTDMNDDEVEEDEESEVLGNIEEDMMINSNTTTATSIEQAATIAVSKDISQMDVVIQEKEEILSKLLDTVKGYSVMKSEFEKLLEAINGLEDEKKELENELERVKKMPGGTVTNTAAAERVNERFLKVKEELRIMRDERKNKENAFRLMQRESKQCDLLQKELKKLKESRVLMAKQHKSQVQEMLKLKKDQAVRSMIVKKNDVKKQQQMNTLKTELAKKERVVVLKDKEISRINMKLRACEEHITQLLKIQNRNRSKLGSNNNTSFNNTNNNTGKVQMNSLNPADSEHLASSKAMLEHMLIERLEIHIAKVMYQQKSSQLVELNRDMEQDASELEALHVEKKQVLLDLRSRGIIPKLQLSDHMMESDGNAACEAIEDDDIDLSTLCGDVMNGLTEEEKYRISQLKTSIDMCENALERLTKEADDCNADIDELSLRIEEQSKVHHKTSKATDNGSAVWDVMGKEIIAGLSLPQSHTLLWDLMDEKLKTLEQLRITNNSLAKCISEQDIEAEKTNELQKWVTTLREELKTRLERAEKQRVNDVWTLMQASSTSPNNNEVKNNNGDVGLTSLSSSLTEGIANRIAVLRANELEKELEACLSNEEALKSDIENKNQLLVKLQKQISQNNLLSEFDVKSSCARESLLNDATTMPTTTTMTMVDDIQIRKLFTVWDELGLPEEERKETLSYIYQARELAKERAIMDADTQLQSTRKEVDVAKEQLQLLCSTIGCAITQYIVDSDGRKLENDTTTNAVVNSESSLQSFLLLPLLDSLKFGAEEATEDIINKLSVISTLKNKLTDIMSEMWLEIADLSVLLRPLAKLSLTCEVLDTLPSDDLNKKYNSATIISQQFMKLNISFKNIKHWEAELRKLNLTRVQTTTKLVNVRDICIGLITELKFNETKKELLELVNSVAASSYSVDLISINNSQKTNTNKEVDQLSSQAINAAVQILSTNSASNPPGSEKLLIALERTKLILESVKSTRITVGQHIGNYVKHFFTHFIKGNESNLENILSPEDLILIDVAITGKVYASCDLERLFVCTDFIQRHSIDMNSSLKSKLQNVISELNNTSIDIINQQINDYLKNKLLITNHLISNFMISMQDIIDELHAMNVFIEEQWIQSYITGIVTSWNSTISDNKNNYTLVNLIKENDAMLEESQRIDSITEVQRELVKGDSTLNRHIHEMDEFEVQSKLDRAKALSGNSKLLIEEEKFRKNGKKKYEQLAERMLQLFSKLNSLTSTTTTNNNNNSTTALNNTTNTNNTPVMIDIKPSLHQLSVKGKALLKGRFREKIELMHLALNSTDNILNNLPTITTTATNIHNNIPKKTSIHNTNNNTTNNNNNNNNCTVISNNHENQKENSINNNDSQLSNHLINHTTHIPTIPSNKVHKTTHQQYTNPFVLDH